MQKKEKVIAIRVTAEEFEAVQHEVGRIVGLGENGVVYAKNKGDVLRYWLNLNLEGAVSDMRKAKKNAEAAAKRKATREAKKAAQ
jgi:RIO-like serine/threonine protein kinase